MLVHWQRPRSDRCTKECEKVSVAGAGRLPCATELGVVGLNTIKGARDLQFEAATVTAATTGDIMDYGKAWTARAGTFLCHAC